MPQRKLFIQYSCTFTVHVSLFLPAFAGDFYRRLPGLERHRKNGRSEGISAPWCSDPGTGQSWVGAQRGS